MLHFPQHDHKHVQAVLKFQAPYFNWATDPILQFFPQKHTYKIILRKHQETLLLFTHTAISIHEHNHITTQTPQVYVSVRTYLMSSLSFLFSLPLFLDYEFHYIFFWTKATLHLAFTPFPDEAEALSLSSLSPSSTSADIISAVPPLSHTLLLMCSDACQVRCSSGKPTPVTLHTHCSRHTCTCIILHMHIPRYQISFQSHTDMFMKTTQVFRLATNHPTQLKFIQIKKLF